MVALRPVSEKLRGRAVRNVAVLAGVSAREARALLDRTAWDVRRAIDAALLGDEEANGAVGARPGPRSGRGR
jgi:N-acetylmuramic acid 6-phosphate (MurNAc-6-P) etherase